MTTSNMDWFAQMAEDALVGAAGPLKRCRKLRQLLRVERALRERSLLIRFASKGDDFVREAAGCQHRDRVKRVAEDAPTQVGQPVRQDRFHGGLCE